MGETQLPPADQVQPGHLQVPERPQPGGAAGDVQPDHEDEGGEPQQPDLGGRLLQSPRHLQPASVSQQVPGLHQTAGQEEEERDL